MIHKGTVFKVKSGSLIIMTGEFEFKEIQKQEPARVGQEISFREEDILRPRSGRFLAVAASILLILLFSASLFRQLLVPDVYAYVGMDINPGFELALNQSLQVIKAEAGNDDGREVLESLSLKGLDLEDAVGAVIKECAAQGYINDTAPDVLITTTLNNRPAKSGDAEKEIKERALSGARTQLKENTVAETEVYVVKIDPEERKTALHEGVSPGHYFLWHKARETGADITLEQVSQQPIGQTMRSMGKTKEELFKITTRAGERHEEKLAPGKKPQHNMRDQRPGKEQSEGRPSDKKVTGRPGHNKDKPAKDRESRNNKPQRYHGPERKSEQAEQKKFGRGKDSSPGRSEGKNLKKNEPRGNPASKGNRRAGE